MAAMSLGFVLANYAPKRGQELFKLMRGVATPIYVMFFVLIGARLSINSMPWWLWIIALVFVLGRAVGKIFATWMGASASRAEPQIRRYLYYNPFQ